jgi:uncharacterized protein (TIGR02444 family)
LAIRLSAEDFWSFSLALYCRASVAQACLSLQERRGADVNLLLAVCWLASRGYETSDAALTAATEAVTPWNEAVLKSLRQTRRRLGNEFSDIEKSDQQSIKHGILSVELECERVAQRLIAMALEPHVSALSHGPARDLAAGGLQRYIGQLTGPTETQDAADQAAIIAQL